MTKDTNEDLTINPNGTGDIYFHSASYYIDDTGNMVAAVFKDSSDTTYFLDPAATGTSLKINGDIELTAGGTIASTANNDITIDAGSGTVCVGAVGVCAGKIDAGTFDPPYTINGKKYATYVPSMVGIKEETTGTVETKLSVISYQPSAVIDFRNQPEGSDLWLFSKVTDLKKNIGSMVVLLSPGGNTRSWYTVDPESMKLTIFTSRPTTVSYRLSAPRFDAEKWQNTREEGSIGHIINDPDSPPSTLDASGYLSQISLTLIKESSPDGSSVWKLTDALGSTVEEFLTASQATIASLTAGSIDVRELVAQSIDVGNLTIGGKTLGEYIREIIETTENRQQRTELISPVASDSAGISVRLGDSQSFGVYTKEGTPAATFDSLGNASISGKLSAVSLQLSADATITGTLYADRIVTRFGEIGSLQTSTIAATYITNVTQISFASPSASIVQNPDATSSALLALLTSDVAGIKEYLSSSDISSNTIIQNTTTPILLGQTSVTGGLLVDGNIHINQSTIETIGDTLSLQPARLGNLDIMGGTIVVNTLGDVVINGNLAISGNVSVGGVLGVNAIESLQSDLILKLASASAQSSVSGTFGSLIQNSKFLIQNPGGVTVTSFDSSGNATVSGRLETAELLTRKLTLMTEKSATDAADAASFGESTLPIGQTTLTISSTSVTQQSLIFITPTSTTDKTLYVFDKKEGQFTVGISAISPTDIRFNWWIIN